MASMTIACTEAPHDRERTLGMDDGFRQFNDWLLALPGQTCCILDEADGRVVTSSGFGAALDGSKGFDNVALLLGLNRGNENSRHARLTVGFEPAEQRHLLWIVTPVEAEVPGYRLQVSLLAGSAPAGHDLGQRLDAALRDQTTRHSTTQPLTALSFLLENVLYAFLESSPQVDYLASKQSDLADQVTRLASVVGDAGVLDSAG